MLEQCVFVENQPVSATALYKLYAAVGWNRHLALSLRDTEASVKAARYHVTAYSGDNLIGFAQVSGDPYAAVVNEVVVRPDRQR